MINQKQFGVWMDSHYAIIVGKQDEQTAAFSVIARINGEEVSTSASNKNENNQKKMHQSKFFKEISDHLQNATSLHVTGTGQAQEQFRHYLADTPQFKNLNTEDSTSNKMTDSDLIHFFTERIK